MGFREYYVDGTRLELLEAPDCANANLFIAAIDDPKINLSIIETLRLHFPNLKILTRARNRIDAYELIDHKVEPIYRETLYSAVNMGVDVVVELGFRKYTATRQANQFIINDEITTCKLAKKRSDKMAYLTDINSEIKWLKKLLKNDIKSQEAANSHLWGSEHLKKKMAQEMNLAPFLTYLFPKSILPLK